MSSRVLKDWLLKWHVHFRCKNVTRVLSVISARPNSVIVRRPEYSSTWTSSKSCNYTLFIIRSFWRSKWNFLIIQTRSSKKNQCFALKFIRSADCYSTCISSTGGRGREGSACLNPSGTDTSLIWLSNSTITVWL